MPRERSRRVRNGAVRLLLSTSGSAPLAGAVHFRPSVCANCNAPAAFIRSSPLATVSEILPIIANHTGIKPAICTWVARRLIEAGLLPRAEGARIPQIEHRDLSRLLIGLLSGTSGANVVEAVRQYSGLLPGAADRGHHSALDWTTELIESLADRDADPIAGRAAYDSQIEIVCSWPEIRIKFSDDEGPLVFVEPGVDPRFWRSDKARRAVTLPGVALSNIVRDIARVPV